MKKQGWSFPAEFGFSGSARGFARGGAVKAALKMHLMKGQGAHPDPEAAAGLKTGGAVRLRERPVKGDFVTSSPRPKPRIPKV